MNFVLRRLSNSIIYNKNRDLIEDYLDQFLRAELGNGVTITVDQYNKELTDLIRDHRTDFMVSDYADLDISNMKREIIELRSFNKTNSLIIK